MLTYKRPNHDGVRGATRAAHALHTALYMLLGVLLLEGCSPVGTTVNSNPNPVAIATNALPAAEAGSPYTATLQASGGTAPYSWSLVGGTMPAGLLLDTTSGVITGTPASAPAPGMVSLTFAVTDSGSPAQSVSTTLALRVGLGKLRIKTTSLPGGTAGVAYSATLRAMGGTQPYSWSLLSGTLPAGLTLNAATGTISGTPAPASGQQLTFQVRDSSAPAQSATVVLAINIALTGGGLTITTTALPSGQVGVAYSTTLAAAGGTAPYSWALTAGTLPAGLTLSPATGAITGTPTVPASAASLTFKVTDSGSYKQSSTGTFPLTIAPATLHITTSALPNGRVGAAYSTMLAASGGTTPYSWALTAGTLPAGLSLNAATGAITGTPSATASATSLTFKVTDSGKPAQSASVTLALTVIASSLRITTTTLPNGQVGAAYSATLAASGGTTPYSWALTAGTLPAGLSLNAATGAITGTPTAAAASSLTFKVTDSGAPAQNASVTLSLTVTAVTLTITTKSLPNGQVGVAYAATLAASGGTTPYSWALTAGTLPAGLSLNAATGAITGTPTAAAASSLTFKVTDSGAPAQNASVTLSLTVTAVTLTITTKSLPNGQVGVAYAATLAASGGTTPYSWALTAGTLPAGLSLNAATGAITGTPTAAAASSLTFKVTDSGTPARNASVTLSLTVTAVTLTITTKSLPNGQVGAAYSATLAASGGTTPYSWALTAGTLPAGLSLNAATGAITGTPTATAAASSLTFKVTDSGTPAQNASVTLPLTVTAVTLTITTKSLPSGQVGVAYTATLAASGGTTPYVWTLSAGSLPAGLVFNAGAITGTPTASASGTPLTFKVTDSSSPAQSQSTTLPLTISPAGTISVSIAPARAALAINQTLPVSATTNDAAGVNWTLTPAGGSITPATSTSGVNVTLTAPVSAGVYTLTATSVTDKTKNASIIVAVTDLPGVFTYHNDLARDGANAQEYALTPSNVNTTTFGKLFSCAVDGAIYAQPLWVANLTVAGAKHNVVIVATQHDSLYAIDADANPCTQLWHMNLIDASHGGTAGETPVAAALVGGGAGDIAPEVGITSTPVIDPAAGIVYLVSKSVSSAGTTFYERLHAIDLATGNEKPGSPVTLAATYPGTGDGGTVVTFNTKQQNQRAGLALVNGTVYIGAGSHADLLPFHGWLLGYRYSGSAFTQTAVYCTTPNAGHSTYGAGIWMSGGAPAADSNGHLYVITGNGLFDANSASAPNNDYGDSFLQLAAGLTVSSYFTVTNQASDDINDYDVGSGGAAIVINLASGSPSHLVVGGGKEGYLYLLDGDNMGGLGDANARQRLTLTYDIFSTAAFWNNTLYLDAVTTPLQSFSFNPATKLFASAPTSQTPQRFIFPTATPSVSAAGSASNGIVWLMDNAPYCTSQSTSCGPTILHAYNATNLASELWNSSMVAGDVAGYAVKFTVPTVANGRVYVGTRGNNTGGAYGSGGIYGELDVYGLKPN